MEQAGTFGSRLRRLRLDRAWRQVDLVEALGGAVARSTLANVEAGRERPSERLWQLINGHLSDWVPHLEQAFADSRPRSISGDRVESARRPEMMLAGPYSLQQLGLVYTFRHSPVPEEIIEIRSVKALRGGADRYGLKFQSDSSEELRLEREALWGGTLGGATEHRVRGETVYLQDFIFPMALRRGQMHHFALRSWVARDPNPGTDVQYQSTIPTSQLTLQLNFYGPTRPEAIWHYGPLADDLLAPRDERHGDASVIHSEESSITFNVRSPLLGQLYGIGWRW